MLNEVRYGRWSYLLTLLVVCISLSACAGKAQKKAEEKKAAEQEKVMQTQQEHWRGIVTAEAERMGDAFRDGDEDLFISYLYPTFVEQVGGVEGARAMMHQIDAEVRGAKGEIVTWTAERPTGEFIEYSGEIQIMIRSFMEMTIEDVTVHNFHDLIGISKDGGKRWYFITTGDHNLDELREFFPNLSPELKFGRTKMELFSDPAETL